MLADPRALFVSHVLSREAFHGLLNTWKRSPARKIRKEPIRIVVDRNGRPVFKCSVSSTSRPLLRMRRLSSPRLDPRLENCELEITSPRLVAGADRFHDFRHTISDAGAAKTATTRPAESPWSSRRIADQ